MIGAVLCGGCCGGGASEGGASETNPGMKRLLEVLFAPAEFEALRMYEVHDKNHVGDTFSRAWASFDPLYKGDVIGTRHNGTPVIATADGCILFPDAKSEPGNEWFYLAKTMAHI